jgi:phenylacetate-CoA ligase
MGAINKLHLLHQVRKNQWLKPSELEELQNKKLRAIVKHAYENTEFYHRKFKDAGVRPDDIRTVNDIHKLPFTTKAEVREHSMGSILSKGVDINSCKVIPTSGSTGKPLRAVYNQNAEDYSKAVNLRSMMENGLKIRDKWVNIGDTRTTSNPSWFQKFGIFNLKTLNLFDGVDNQINTLIEMNPDTILGYPSQLSLIANYIKKHSIEGFTPKNVFTTAELLHPPTRELINSVFNTDLVDLFGCIEVNRTAWECSEHCGYHLDVDSVITEFIQDGDNVAAGERGNIAYTCLFNYAMPLIRYEVGDVGVPSDEKCSCGRSLPLMKNVEGRTDDFIKLPSGKIISPIVLVFVMRHLHEILEYQIVQESLNCISVYLVISENVNDFYINNIKKDIENALDNEISIKIKVQSAIKKGSTGKMRSIISKLK